MVEQVPCMNDQVNVPGEDVIDGGGKRPFDIDRTLVTAGIGTGPVERAIAKVRVGQVSDAERAVGHVRSRSWSR